MPARKPKPVDLEPVEPEVEPVDRGPGPADAVTRASTLARSK